MSNFSSQLNTILDNLHTSSLGTFDNELFSNLNQTSKTLISKLTKSTQETWLYIYMTLYYNKLNKIELDCRKCHISEDLLNLEELKVDLTKLKEKLAPKNRDLAIPHKIRAVYSLQLAECRFENGNIIV